MSLGRVLKLIRTNKNMTQKKVTDDMGISRAYLSLIETDRIFPSSKKLSAFAKVFNISKDALIFLSTDPPKELSDDGQKKYVEMQRKIIGRFIFKLV